MIISEKDTASQEKINKLEEVASQLLANFHAQTMCVAKLESTCHVNEVQCQNLYSEYKTEHEEATAYKTHCRQLQFDAGKLSGDMVDAQRRETYSARSKLDAETDERSLLNELQIASLKMKQYCSDNESIKQNLAKTEHECPQKEARRMKEEGEWKQKLDE